MQLRLYNTMTRTVDEFKPLHPPVVTLYTCGPTVYNFAHIGNLRTYVFEDILVRTLKTAGFEVKRVMNVTDVGHLTDDADAGEDKMEKGAAREGKTVLEIAQSYWDAFCSDMRRLNILEPDVWCRATDEIQTQIDQVKILAEKGFTYRTNDGIYFDTSKLSDYGKLARLDVSGLRAGHRVEIVEGKRNPTDFALWKFSPKDKKRLMEWPSPWGVGFPGWHIECSAMAIKYLGERLDIHCGGVDHVQVHHTNEIAQAESAIGHVWCNWWMHGEFLTIPKNENGDGGKMSKSSGEFLTLNLLVDKGYDPQAYRYFLLGAHYRQQLTFTLEGLDAAANAYKNLKSKVLELKKPGLSDAQPLAENVKKFHQVAFSDLNMPQALAVMWATLKITTAKPAQIYATLLEMDKILGLGLADMQEDALGINEAEIQNLIEERAEAKKSKNFARADEIRKNLTELGIELMDSPQGTTWRRK